MPDKPADGTAALDKALDVLDAIGRSGAGLSQAELGAQLALPRTTLYRLLGTLTARGLLRRDPQRRVYCLGLRCFEYARAAYAMPDLVAAAGAELRGLRDMTGETTYLAALDGLEVVALDRCDSAHGRRSNTALGQRKPLHCTSQGKAILAALPAEQREAIVRELPLAAVTPRSITERRRLQAELRLTATRGWSIDDEEIVPGVRCCGAAIVDAQGAVRGAISVAGPAFRLTMERLGLIGPEVAEAARRIGAQLAAAQGGPHAAGEARAVPGGWAFDGAWPAWSDTAGALFWADTLAPAVHLATPAGDRVLAPFDAPIQALLPHADGAAVLAGEQWTHLDAEGTRCALPDLPRRRASAVCAGPDGRFWACVADGERWRVAELSGEAGSAGGWRLAEPATALAWDPQGQCLFIAAADSGTLHVALPGSTALRRLATVPKGSGRLAGLAADGAGGVWSALRGGWSVVRFDADGAMDRVITLPVPCPTALGFDAARRLYITSARDAVDREALEAAPLSGRLFVVDDAAPAAP
ncbi:MAG: SMP-30/gluconolactonase/LRE family protein [Piscinibacter sp.]|nr:SMP-30/gluconolactonase/LRE family protein [Piscinibacter sp.]